MKKLTYTSMVLFLGLTAHAFAADAPTWACEGSVAAYHDGWKNVAKFQVAGPATGTNFVQTDVEFDGIKSTLELVHNAMGTSNYGDETAPEENISSSIRVGGKRYNGGSFSAIGAALPNQIGLRNDFQIEDGTAYIVRLVCTRK